MRLRNVKNASDLILAHPEWIVLEPETNKGNWKAVFGNDHLIWLEIGCGKGKFLLEMAHLHPDINFLGIEKFDSVIVRTLQKAMEEPHANLRLIRTDAAYLPDFFAKGEIDRLYLNFSDPWPKPSHSRRRLTSPQFLERYQAILSQGSRILIKTDNFPLFAFSMVSIVDFGMRVATISLDLHHETPVFNVETEFEAKFVAMGKPIFYLEAIL
jgi:tRNA (guanine-N7-)-methyltransferase